MFIHSYPYLQPVYPSLYDELLLNELHPIDEPIFCNLLTKAIKHHDIAVTKYQNEFGCKYYKREYGILRNDPIGLPHILCLIIYTDVTDFCSEFRSTYRKIDGETTTKEVESRHVQLYHFSRYLFESVEFYGFRMQKSLTVYHGLNKLLYFGNFNAYFNQPISTTTDLNTAQQFATKGGNGIILSLKAGTNYKNNRNRMPKYLSVSWLSVFPNEDEKLFYGAYVRFKISDIMDHTLHQHQQIMQLYNKFQDLLDNIDVEWDENKESGQHMIETLVILLRHQQSNSNPSNADEHMKNSPIEITEYARELFDYFCKHRERRNITIRNFSSLPSILYQQLFTTEETVAGSDKHSPSSTIDCSNEQLISLLQTHASFDDGKINQFKEEIIEYLKQNQINGECLMAMSRKKFSDSLVQHLNGNKKVRGPANKTWDRFNHLALSDADDVIFELSFIPISKVFPYLMELKLNGLKMAEFLINIDGYINLLWKKENFYPIEPLLLLM